MLANTEIFVMGSNACTPPPVLTTMGWHSGHKPRTNNAGFPPNNRVM